MKIYLSILLLILPFLFYGSSFKSELHAQVTETIIPGSDEVHKKLGIKAIEKEYAVITFTKRKSNEDALFTTISFKWDGPYIEHISATFFKKTYNDKPLLPLEENVIGEGKWNNKQQILSFTFKEIKLQGINRFSLVFLVTPELETLLPQGTFSIISSCLPEAFQQNPQTKYLSLSYNS